MRLVIAICLCLAFLNIDAQVTFSRGNLALELKGSLNTYLSILTTDNRENLYGFELRDARITLQGENHSRFKYKFEIDFAAVNSDLRADYFIIDAQVNIDLPDRFDAYVGFQRLPISRNSHVSVFNSVFSRRPPMSGGALYYRRGLGVVMQKKMLNNRFNIHAGVFNNNGAIRHFDEGSVKLSYVARIDFALPSRARYEEVDIRMSPVPVFGIGANFLHSRYSDEIELELFPLHVNGRKMLTSVDVMLMYRGFSIQGEYTYAWLNRNEDADASLASEFNSGGLHTSLNYFIKDISTVVAGRFEMFNPNNALYDEQFVALTFGANYLVSKGHDIVVRTDFRFFVNDDISETPFNQRALHLGFQMRF